VKIIHKAANALAAIRRWSTLAILILWSVVVACALGWLIQGENGPSVVIIDGRDSTETQTQKRIQGFFKSETGFAHLLPWILFGPYVGLLVLRFPLERHRLKMAVPLNLAACVAFLYGAHWIGSFKVFTQRKVVIIGRQETWDHSDTNANVGSREGSLSQDIRSFHNTTVDRRVVRWSNEGGELKITDSILDQSAGEGSNFFSAGAPKMPMDTMLPIPPGGSRIRYWPTLIDLLAYGAMVGFAHSVHFYRRFREREHKALTLESSLARAQLNVLKAQLQPHFLFNSLNAIVTLLRRDARAAETTLISLSELLRTALNYSERSEITLREELEFVNRYIELQRTRFGDKLRVEQEIDSSALDALTPSLLLQPIVENAIRHGIEPSDQPGVVRLSARPSGDRLALIVADNGVGLTGANGSAPAMRNGTGIGLKNLQVRLETLYGTNQKFEIAGNENGGVTVRIEIPWQVPTGSAAPERSA
jgi:two-component sensor histidine kinase